MDIIIKPTMACNFKCTFCSSSNISKDKTKELSIEYLKNILKDNTIDNLIVNGGDPLMMSPSYYKEMIKYIKENKLKTKISITSNLWDFYLHKDKWIEIFKDDNVGVCTSFQFGGGRLKGNNEIFSKKDFIEIFNLFEKEIGEKLSFIGVITKDSEAYVIKTVEMAKSLGTKCKMNPAVMSGKSTSLYPFYKALEHYYNIYKKGLSEYEFNTSAIIDLLNNKSTICPYNRTCVDNIRCISPEEIIHSCGCFNDDHYENKKNGQKTYDLGNYGRNEIKKDYPYIKSSCLSCEFFNICNSCFKRIRDIKISNNEEVHCKNAKKILKKFKMDVKK